MRINMRIKRAGFVLLICGGMIFWGVGMGAAQQQLKIDKIRPPEGLEPIRSPMAGESVESFAPVRSVQPVQSVQPVRSVPEIGDVDPRSGVVRGGASSSNAPVRRDRGQLLRPEGIGYLGRVDREEGVIVIGDKLLPLSDGAVFFSGSLGTYLPSSKYQPGVQIAYEFEKGRRVVKKVWLYDEIEAEIQRE